MLFQELIQLPYQQFLAYLSQECPPSYSLRDWIERQYTISEIAQMNGLLYRALYRLSAIDNDSQECEFLRDQMDLYWYAGDINENQFVILQIAKQLESEENNMVGNCD
jgi:hypothetical protein